MIYLDNAATTFPKPPGVCEEICKCISKYCGNPGRSSHKLSLKCAEKIYNTRVLIADMFSAEAENVCFTYNTTYALNIAVKSFVKDNDHILISDIEHNSVLRPVYNCSKENMCSYTVFDTNGTDEDILNNIYEKIRSNTSLLICTHVSNIGSRRLPIEKIGKLCKEKNIRFIVDGAQSAGIYDININKMNIDALCIPGHKALYGPQGVGVLIFGRECIGKTLIQGGTGISSLELDMPEFLPERYEGGTLATPNIIGLGEGLKWLKSVGIAKLRLHEESLYDTLKELLSFHSNITVYEMSNHSGNTLLFNIGSHSPSHVSSILNKADIYVRSGFHCAPLAHKTLGTGEGGAVRVSFGAYNTKKDVYSLYDALQPLIKK